MANSIIYRPVDFCPEFKIVYSTSAFFIVFVYDCCPTLRSKNVNYFLHSLSSFFLLAPLTYFRYNTVDLECNLALNYYIFEPDGRMIHVFYSTINTEIRVIKS